MASTASGPRSASGAAHRPRRVGLLCGAAGRSAGPSLGESHCVVPGSSTRRPPVVRAFLDRGTRPPRLVAHGVPAERLADPVGWYYSLPCGATGRSAGPCSGRATAWCLAPLGPIGPSPVFPCQRNMALTASGPRSASRAACRLRRAVLHSLPYVTFRPVFLSSSNTLYILRTTLLVPSVQKSVQSCTLTVFFFFAPKIKLVKMFSPL
ncbi:hypothetical protein CAAN4_C08482 [[Candida] anglica]|uniref:Uncharacterized protein n=1 Tax=[Candida] anglica TaxID=148631 RepID=A0ABP0EB48_9ASCO